MCPRAGIKLSGVLVVVVDIEGLFVGFIEDCWTTGFVLSGLLSGLNIVCVNVETEFEACSSTLVEVLNETDDTGIRDRSWYGGRGGG